VDNYFGWHVNICDNTSVPTANLVIAGPLTVNLFDDIQNSVSNQDYDFYISLSGSAAAGTGWSNPVQVYYNDYNFYTNDFVKSFYLP
jgi:hypothetical protein